MLCGWLTESSIPKGRGLLSSLSVPIESCPADSERLANRGHALGRVVPENLRLAFLLLIHHDRSPSLPASRPGRDNPRPGALSDKVPLELGESCEDVEDELAPARGRVYGLRNALEAHRTPLQLLDRLYQVLEASAESIEPPDHERVSRA